MKTKREGETPHLEDRHNLINDFTGENFPSFALNPLMLPDGLFELGEAVHAGELQQGIVCEGKVGRLHPAQQPVDWEGLVGEVFHQGCQG
jgi:hypothetical protein